MLCNRLRSIRILLGLSCAVLSAAVPTLVRAQDSALASTTAEAEAKVEPFAWGDFSWMNGASRQSKRLIDTEIFTGQVDLDVNYTYSFAHPIDDTVVGSTALARNNELELSFLAVGGDFHYQNVRGRLLTQFGTRSSVIPRNDASINRGQFDLATAYRYLSEAYTGYHFDALQGINLDVGLFMSYVGLFSYDNWENWAYQPSFTSDNTPWFFNGARLQVFPTDRLKFEVWLINGWQTYAKFNNLPGFGFQVMTRPAENMSFVSNGYIGTDTQDHPGRVRYHSDNSFLLRYLNRPGEALSRAAMSFTFDIGFENGAGVTPFGYGSEPAQNFLSGMFYHRMWFLENTIGWTFGGGYISNPGRYLVLLPTGAAADPSQFAQGPGTTFQAWDISTTVDWNPTDWNTWRIEFVHREASDPYFAGRGGVTSPDGYGPTPAGFQADLRKTESRLIIAFLSRF